MATRHIIPLANILNKLKSLILTVLLLAVWSCSNDKFVAEFESTLGNENSQFLTELVFDFENDFLKRQYPNLEIESAYKKLMLELRDGQIDDWKKISTKSRNKFEKSLLKSEIYQYPDSVWVEKDTAEMTIKSKQPVIKSRFKYVSIDGTIEYLEAESSIPPMEYADIAWLLKRQKESPEFNTSGKYFQALYKVKDRDEFFKKFYERKNSMGFIGAETLASVMLYENVDFNDYLIKRIIMLEIVY